MLSKLLRVGCSQNSALLTRKIPTRVHGMRRMEYIPPNQYEIKIPRKFHLSYSLRVYWEIIPLVMTSVFSFAILFIAIGWAAGNKVDVVYSTRSRDNISRTMDLRNPSIHKMMIVNQRYEPWPEMQDVLDKMRTAEKRSLARAQTCKQS